MVTKEKIESVIKNRTTDKKKFVAEIDGKLYISSQDKCIFSGLSSFMLSWIYNFKTKEDAKDALEELKKYR